MSLYLYERVDFFEKYVIFFLLQNYSLILLFMKSKAQKIDDLLALSAAAENFDGKFNLFKNYLLDKNTSKEDNSFFGMIFILTEVYASDPTHYDERMKSILSVSDQRWLLMFAIANYANGSLPSYKKLLKELNITSIDNLILEIDDAVKLDYKTIPNSYIQYLIFSFNGEVNVKVIQAKRLFLRDMNKLNLIREDYVGFISVIFLNLK